MTELIDAFAFLQEKNLSHGDVKPRNLFMSSQGKMKIGDFGESRQEQALVTKTYQIAGTVIYFSPLLFKAYLDIIKGINNTGTAKHNPIKSDVYSLGLTFLHIASLEKPIDLNNIEQSVEILQAKVNGNIERLPYSQKLKCLFYNMLQVEESKRYDFVQLRVSLIRSLNSDVQIESKVKTGKRGIPSRVPSPIFSLPILFSMSQTSGSGYIYHPTEDRISTITSAKFQPSSKAIMIDDYTIIITGGQKNSDLVFTFHLETRQTKKLRNMNVPRAWHSICKVGDEIYVIGGKNLINNTALSSVEVYNNEE